MTTPSTPSRPIGCACSVPSIVEATSAPRPEDWLTPDDVVALLRGALSLGTLRNYRSARIGPMYVRVGRTVFYPRTAVDAWLAEQVRDSESRWNDHY